MNPVPPTSQNPTPLSYFGETNEEKKIESRCLKDIPDDELKELSVLPDKDRAREIFASFSPEDIEEHIDRVDDCSLLNLLSPKQLDNISPSCLTVRRLQAIFSGGYIKSARLITGLSKDRLRCLLLLIEEEVGLATSTDKTASEKPLGTRLFELLDLSNSSSLWRLQNHDKRLKEKEEKAIKELRFEEDTLTEVEVMEHLSKKETLFLSDGLFKKIFFIADRKKVKERVTRLPVKSIEADARRMEAFHVLRLLSPQQLAIINLSCLSLDQVLQIFPSGMEDIFRFTEGLSLERLRIIMNVFFKHLKLSKSDQKKIESFETKTLIFWLIVTIKILKKDREGVVLCGIFSSDL